MACEAQPVLYGPDSYIRASVYLVLLVRVGENLEWAWSDPGCGPFDRGTSLPRVQEVFVTPVQITLPYPCRQRDSARLLTGRKPSESARLATYPD
jgi:hypothetical protein